MLDFIISLEPIIVYSNIHPYTSTEHVNLLENN